MAAITRPYVGIATDTHGFTALINLQKKYCNPVCFDCAYTIHAYKLCNVLLHKIIFLFLLSIFMYITCFSVCCLVAINFSLVWSLCEYSVQQNQHPFVFIQT